MKKEHKAFLTSLILIAVLLLLNGSSLALEEGTGRVTRSDLAGAISLTRADGSITTIDYDATLTLATRSKRIIMDLVGAGVVQGTGEQVLIDFTSLGVVRRQGTDARFNATGLLVLERPDGTRVLIDIVSVGIVQRQGRYLNIEFGGTGVARGRGETILIDVIGAGIRAR